MHVDPSRVDMIRHLSPLNLVDGSSNMQYWGGDLGFGDKKDYKKCFFNAMKKPTRRGWNNRSWEKSKEINNTSFVLDLQYHQYAK